jgi:hypothetical protein
MCLLAVCTLSLVVDANGNVTRLGESASFMITVLVFGVAFMVATVLVIVGQRWVRILAVVSMVLYLW